MENNICKFIPKSEEEKSINILNFVHETKKQKIDEIHCDAVYKMHFVTNGSGKIDVFGKSRSISRGDVFFTFPSMRYSIDSGVELEYMYISFLGTRANQIMDKLKITKNNFLFCGFDELSELWKSSIFDDVSVLNLRCEGIMLYTFSKIAKPTTEKENRYSEAVPKIKKYIDENFTDSDLSLEKISKETAYNKKYISSAFKKSIGIGISKYITLLRIQHACSLIQQGFTSVKDISTMCGYDEALYFSRVFKEKMNMSPKDYILSLRK